MKNQSKILIILSRIPWPLEKGDKLRAFHQIKYLSKYHSIILCCLSDEKPHPEAEARLQPYCEEIHIFRLSKTIKFKNLALAVFNGNPFQIAYFYNASVHKAIKSIFQRIKPDTVYCQLVRTALYGIGMDCRKVIDYQDAFSAGMRRQAKEASGWKKLLLLAESKKLKRFENEIYNSFDEKTIISAADRELITHPEKNLIHIIPNGIDTEYFKEEDKEKKYELLFTGNMNYPPNILASEFLVHKILPLVQLKHPASRLILAGASPNKRVQKLGSAQVFVTGWVEDIRDCYSASQIFIAPMTIGTGLQNKLLEAMAMGIPCITSPLANEALGAKNGETILIGTNTEEFAAHIDKLLIDKAFAKEMAMKARNFVHTHFSWEAACIKLSKLM